MTDHEYAPQTFGEISSQADGVWNKVRLASRYALMTVRDLSDEAAANAFAVWYSDDPVKYQAEKEERRLDRVAHLGEWATEQQITGPIQ